MNPNSLLLTDLYQLTMLQGYFQQRMEEVAVFEFFVREMPEERNFFMAAGLRQVLDFLKNLAITKKELDWLYGQKKFNDDFLDYLNTLRFTGDVHAMPEGAVFFPDEPIIRVTAPIPQAQLVETRIINILQFQTMIASKAARMQLAAPGKQMVDFGLRRAHGAEAGLFAARASYLAGFTPHGQAIWQDLPVAPPCRRVRCLTSPFSAPWLIPLFRPMTAKRRPFSTLL
jgi:nicotinate phosphoribosyltransferase